jgi:hypothetical protein
MKYDEYDRDIEEMPGMLRDAGNSNHEGDLRTAIVRFFGM